MVPSPWQNQLTLVPSSWQTTLAYAVKVTDGWFTQVISAQAMLSEQDLPAEMHSFAPDRLAILKKWGFNVFTV